jgi:hypothetical protein
MKNLYEKIVSNGGATVKNGKIVSYKKGYQVAVNSVEKKFKALYEALDYAADNKLDSIGLWLDGGVWYMDTNTKRFTSRAEALKVAKENKQLAVWDWEKGVSIYA